MDNSSDDLFNMSAPRYFDTYSWFELLTHWYGPKKTLEALQREIFFVQ